MVFDEPLKACGHVEYIFLPFDGQDDGRNLLFEIVLYQLDSDPHHCN